MRLSTVTLLLGTYFTIYVNGFGTECFDCTGCTAKDLTAYYPDLSEGIVFKPPSCLTENGFCLTKISSFGRIDRSCSEDREKYKAVGCSMMTDTAELNMIRVCRCDESKCNNKDLTYEYKIYPKCWQCSDCPRTDIKGTDDETFLTGQVSSCDINDGFCITKISSDGRIDRECSDDREKYKNAGCFMTDATGDDKKLRVCRCDEPNCNSKHEEYGDEGNSGEAPSSDNMPNIGFEFTWWIIMFIVIGVLLAILAPVICCCCICGVPAACAGILVCMSQENRERHTREKRRKGRFPAPSAPSE